MTRPLRACRNENHGRIRKSLVDPALQKPLEHPIAESRQLELSMSADWKSKDRDLEGAGRGMPSPALEPVLSSDPFQSLSRSA